MEDSSRPEFVAVYLIHKTELESKYLIIKRDGSFFGGIWQIVTGKFEGDENIVAAAMREVFEETGFSIKGLYSVDIIPFYNRFKDRLSFSANFCMFVDDVTFQMSKEHKEFVWADFNKDKSLLSFPDQTETLTKIHHHFVLKTPHEVNFLVSSSVS